MGAFSFYEVQNNQAKHPYYLSSASWLLSQPMPSSHSVCIFRVINLKQEFLKAPKPSNVQMKGIRIPSLSPNRRGIAHLKIYTFSFLIIVLVCVPSKIWVSNLPWP